ncbi:MAG: BTAD domain-containing putative transcriptional regulator [Solirubrobacterales bacterium]
MSAHRVGRIARPALAKRVCEGLERGSVMLVAGAGYGKSTVIEEALELTGNPSVWLRCGEASREPARLLSELVERVRSAVPGLGGTVGDALNAPLERVDVGSATTAFVVDVERLLVEPLVIVVDDAEGLEGSGEALAVLDQLLNVRGAPLSLAIGTRVALPLRIGKLRASGELLELGQADLIFSAAETEQVLELRRGGAPSEAEVESVQAASRGWPIAVALTGMTNDAGGPGPLRSEDLFRYLAEEVLERLGEAERLQMVDSGVPDALTPTLAADLGLPDGFNAAAEASGLFRRGQDGSGTYHPLFLGFLRERLRAMRTEQELADLHARVAASLVSSGLHEDAIEHWLAAGRHEEALQSLVAVGPRLTRVSPGLATSYIAALPPELRTRPDCLLLEGQILWGTGDHERALTQLRAAADGFRAAGQAELDWLARILLADTLVFTGAFEEISDLARGWEDAQGAAAFAAAAVAWFQLIALATTGRFEEAEELRGRLHREPEALAQFGFLDAIAHCSRELAAGNTEEALGLLRSAIEQLEMGDPQGRMPYVLGIVLVILRLTGRRGDALAWLERCEEEAERVGMGFATQDFRLQRASLLARRGELEHAEIELAHAGGREGGGWGGIYQAEAEARVASGRGEAAVAATAARAALDHAARAPMPWRVLICMEMAALLCEAGAPEAALEAIARTRSVLDEQFPGERGRLYRAWLLASAACLGHRTGEAPSACEELARAWEQAGDQAGAMVRAHWPSIRPVLWEALAEGLIETAAALPAMQEALPGGEALVEMTDHPEAAVRSAALVAAIGADHPAVLAELPELAESSEEAVARAARVARRRLREDPPPLAMELYGGFRVKRAGWEIEESAWKRPMAARVVRFLIVMGPDPVSEDALFEAFWADRPSDAARQHLAVAVSRARKVLDLPESEQSVIEARERTYRLALREVDRVDVWRFERAARMALEAGGEERRAALEHAAEQWSGELLPQDRYSEWTFGWRERMAELHADLLTALLESYEAAGQVQRSIHAARRLLEFDPTNERAHRVLMLGYARTGRVSQALRQYLECRSAMVTELGVEPSEETSRIQAAILTGETV